MRIKREHDRIINKFLMLPVTIDRETRWLEKAKIEQAYDIRYKKWENIRFVG